MTDRDPHDEAIDGPKVAAAILNRMNPENREKIVRSLQASHPTLAVKIEENLYHFDDIAELTPQGVQLLLSSIERRDLLLSLKNASDKVKAVLFSNMSERMRAATMADFDAMPPARLSEVEDAKRRILAVVEKLRTSGAIRSNSKDVWV